MDKSTSTESNVTTPVIHDNRPNMNVTSSKLVCNLLNLVVIISVRSPYNIVIARTRSCRRVSRGVMEFLKKKIKIKIPPFVFI